MGTYSISTIEGPSPSRSFFSRFALPFRSINRSLADFHIRPDEPHRNYSAGDHVGGAVVLAVPKAIRITHLVVALHGYVRVYKGPAAVNEPVTVPSGSGRIQYHGNGYASLFHDEQVLSGEGRLEVGKYEFNFDLEFPEKGLPSSIDFERGTITYNVVATLTRPTTISPTIQCDRKVTLIERVDIGLVTPPRPRTIFLEPISKRARRKKMSGSEKPPVDVEPADAPATVSEEPSPEQHGDVRSDFSGESALSTSTGHSVRGGAELSSPSAPGLSQSGTAKLQAVDEKTITTTIELLKGGCLPGDMISVKVSVQHIKRIKSMHGVIVTLYRQGRIDSSPPTSLFTDMSVEDAKRVAKEDYYPRSKTGLGGLSLSSASSLSVFRKDLSQTVAPFIINPATLNTTVTVSVKVPEDCFPTIRNVPGEMITFKYQLEVLVDLGGRLANQIQSGGPSSRLGTFPATGSTADGTAGYTAWAGTVVDTSHLKREKGVIYDSVEVVIGTLDSTRQRMRGLSRTFTHHTVESLTSQDDIIAGWQHESNGHTNGALSPHPPPSTYLAMPIRIEGSASQTLHQPSVQAPAYIPPPDIHDESQLSEKERIRRQEQRLLPSQPSRDAAEAGPSQPSAPALNIRDPDDTAATAPLEQAQAEDDGPSAPTMTDFSSDAGAEATVDKQELERQRLMNEASAPPVFPDDHDAGASSTEQPDGNLEPSAPTLGDEDDYGIQYSYGSTAGPSSQPHAHGSEQLPAYER